MDGCKEAERVSTCEFEKHAEEERGKKIKKTKKEKPNMEKRKTQKKMKKEKIK